MIELPLFEAEKDDPALARGEPIKAHVADLIHAVGVQRLKPVLGRGFLWAQGR
jgi:hypothetical protein